MKDEEIDKMADDFVNAQEFTKVYGTARKAECGAFWKYGFLAGLKAGRPQWHYVKDGDYPKDNKLVLCILGDVDSDSYEVGYYNDVGSGEPWHFETYHLPDDDGDNAWGVSAWKEIVLPKESE